MLFRVPRECSALCSGLYGARVMCQIASSSVLTYNRPKETYRSAIHTRTNFTGSTQSIGRSMFYAKVAMLFSTLRPSTAGNCRPKRLSTSVQSAALWTYSHASTASCLSVGRLERPRQWPAEAPTKQRRRRGDYLIRRDGRRTCPASRSKFARCSTRPRSVPSRSVEKSPLNAEKKFLRLNAHSLGSPRTPI